MANTQDLKRAKIVVDYSVRVANLLLEGHALIARRASVLRGSDATRMRRMMTQQRKGLHLAKHLAERAREAMSVSPGGYARTTLLKLPAAHLQGQCFI